MATDRQTALYRALGPVPNVGALSDYIDAAVAARAGTKYRSQRGTISACFNEGNGTAISNLTKSIMVHIPGDADFIRLVFANGTGSSFPMLAKWAPTAQVGNGYAPYKTDGTIDTSLFQDVTFQGAGADTNPEDNTGGGSVTATVTANTPFFFSDWMRVTGSLVARTDTADPIKSILIRSQAATGTPWGNSMANNGILADTPNIFGPMSGFSSVTAIGTVGATDFTANNITYVFAVQYFSRLSGYTILYCGSSIMLGTTTTNGRSCFTRIACRSMSIATGRPFTCLYNSIGATYTHSLITAGALAKIAAYKPGIVLIQAANRNSAHTAAQQDLDWAGNMQVVDAALRNNAIPVLVTATPWPSGDAADAAGDAIRQINNNRARAMAASGTIPVLDYDLVVTDGGSPARILPYYNDSLDVTHAGDTGHAAVAAALVTLLRQITGL